MFLRAKKASAHSGFMWSYAMLVCSCVQFTANILQRHCMLQAFGTTTTPCHAPIHTNTHCPHHLNAPSSSWLGGYVVHPPIPSTLPPSSRTTPPHCRKHTTTLLPQTVLSKFDPWRAIAVVLRTRNTVRNVDDYWSALDFQPVTYISVSTWCLPGEGVKALLRFLNAWTAK